MNQQAARLALPRAPRAGNLLEEVGSPALLVDLDAFEFNLRHMAALARQHGVSLRPHAKAHKSSAIAARQLAEGAVGICCQKLSEAYPFAQAGIRDIYVSNEFIGGDKLAMAVELAAHVELSVCVDHPRQVAELGAAASRAGVSITVLPEVDVGQGRCGVAEPDALMALVDALSHHASLKFGGLQAYHGGLQHVRGWAERREGALRAAEATQRFVEVLASRGVRCARVTGGGTGTVEFDAASGVYSEIQPGSYIFLDGDYGDNEWRGALRPRHSLFLVSTVMSTARPGKAVCDLGLKGAAVDSGLPRLAAGDPRHGLRYVAANDEHGILEVPESLRDDLLGERLLLVPGHCDPTANLYARYVGFRGDRVECVWDIDARGLSQ